MFLNIMYYDLSNETAMTNSTNTIGLSVGPVNISLQQVDYIDSCLNHQFNH